jgi:hypothetical protein
MNKKPASKNVRRLFCGPISYLTLLINLFSPGESLRSR